VKVAEGEEIAIPGIIATSKSLSVTGQHMQDQYFGADRADGAEMANVVLRHPFKCDATKSLTCMLFSSMTLLGWRFIRQ